MVWDNKYNFDYNNITINSVLCAFKKICLKSKNGILTNFNIFLTYNYFSEHHHFQAVGDIH